MLKRIGDIVMLQLSDMDSNIYLIGDTVIDTGTGFNFIRMRDMMRVLKLSLEDVKTIINTHYHFDHIGGDGFFPNAKISIHQDDAPTLEKGDAETTVADYFGGNMHPMKVEKKLKDGDVLNLGKLSFQVIHTPGHTPGSICLYEKKQKILISGDTVFADALGRTDLPGGDPNELKTSLEKLKKLDVDKILPGHGPIVDKDGKKKIEFLQKHVQIGNEDEESDVI